MNVYVILLAGIHHASLEEEASSMTTTHLATAVDTQARNLYGGTCIMLFFYVNDIHNAIGASLA